MSTPIFFLLVPHDLLLANKPLFLDRVKWLFLEISLHEGSDSRATLLFPLFLISSPWRCTSWCRTLIWIFPSSFGSWRLVEVPEQRLLQTSELRGSLVSWISLAPNYPETNRRLASKSQIRLLLSHIVRRSAKCVRFIRISSWVFPFHETELFIPRLIREYTYEFGKSDVLRVKGFCPIPQHDASCISTSFSF
jgi:hypothetical protein